MRKALVGLQNIECDNVVKHYGVVVNEAIAFTYKTEAAAAITIQRLREHNPDVDYDIQELWHCSHTAKEIAEDER